MDAVALVQAYLRVNGYFTVTEYPVLERTLQDMSRATPWTTVRRSESDHPRHPSLAAARPELTLPRRLSGGCCQLGGRYV